MDGFEEVGDVGVVDGEVAFPEAELTGRDGGHGGAINCDTTESAESYSVRPIWRAMT